MIARTGVAVTGTAALAPPPGLQAGDAGQVTVDGLLSGFHRGRALDVSGVESVSTAAPIAGDLGRDDALLVPVALIGQLEPLGESVSQDDRLTRYTEQQTPCRGVVGAGWWPAAEPGPRARVLSFTAATVQENSELG